MREVVRRHEFRRLRAVGIDQDIRIGLVDLVGHGPALDTTKMRVGFVVDAPHFFDDDGAIDVGNQRRVGIHVNHRRQFSVIGLEHPWINAKHAFLKLPEPPHVDPRMDRPIRAKNVHGLWQIQHVPEIADPRTSRDHDLATFDFAFVGYHGGDRAACVIRLHTYHGHAVDDPNADILGFLRQAIHRRGVVGESATFFVQHRRDTLGLPIVKDSAHIRGRRIGALNEIRLITNGALLLEDRGDVVAHRLAADL